MKFVLHRHAWHYCVVMTGSAMKAAVEKTKSEVLRPSSILQLRPPASSRLRFASPFPPICFVKTTCSTAALNQDTCQKFSLKNIPLLPLLLIRLQTSVIAPREGFSIRENNFAEKAQQVRCSFHNPYPAPGLRTVPCTHPYPPGPP